MTRDDLLRYIEQARTQRRARSGWLALGVIGFCAIGVWMLGDGQLEGWVPILFFGGGASGGILMALLEPKPTYEGGPLEARVAWGSTLFSLLAMGAAVAGAFVFAEERMAETKGLIVGVCGAFLAVVMLLRIVSLFRPGPALVIDAKGVYDSRAMRNVAAWDEIMSFDRIEMKSNVFYRLRLRDETALSLTSRLNGMFGVQGVTLNCLGLTCGNGDMLLAINAYRPGLLGWLSTTAAA
ncbi:hypothetical protein BH10PSE3_BH10PSE3_26140 [soil metagenome]